MRYLTAADSRMTLVQEEPRGPSQLIEVNATVNGLAKIPFPDVANLRNQADQKVIIKALRCITPSVLTNAPTSGNVVAPLTELQKISVVLYCEGWQKGQNIPILSLNDIFTEGSGEPYRNSGMKFDSWQNIDWDKSYLEYSNGSGGVAGQPYTVLLEVEYVRLKMDVKTETYVEIVGPA